MEPEILQRLAALSPAFLRQLAAEERVETVMYFTDWTAEQAKAWLCQQALSH